ncbi:MAG: hypothetical protein P8100_03360 [bacterium]
MRKIIRFFARTIILMLIILLGMLLIFYLLAPVYEFSGPKPFHGDKLYNPYQGMDKSHWKRYNFQVQSKAWGGITDGRKNSNRLIDSVYKELGFDYVATSDYQKINYHGSGKPDFIPTYEHGYNAFKTHQVCIDAQRVLWTDLILFQTLSMKQWIIDQLDKDCSIVVLAHPLLRHGYTVEEMKYLTHYEMMEVLNNLRISTDHWDTALSSGQLVWLMGNDDAHDVLHPNDVGRKFTMINSPTKNKAQILSSLHSGCCYGVDFYPTMDVPLKERIERIKHTPILQNAALSGDTLQVRVDVTATEIHFIGQEGIVRQTSLDTNQASYIIKPEDTYVRTVFRFNDGSSIYLNPVVRYAGDQPESLLSATVDQRATLLLRIAYFLVALTLVYLYRRRKQKSAGN